MKHRILIINWEDIKNPLSGGAEVHLFEIFKRLVNSYEIHLLCSGFEGAAKEEVIDGIFVHRVGKRNNFNFYVVREFAELDKKYNFDLVIEDINKLPFFGRFFIPVKRIGIVHHLFGKLIYYETNFISGSYVYILERSISYFYRDIPLISVSKSTKMDLVKIGIPMKNIKVIYNGVDFAKFRPREKSREPLIVGIGRLKRYKRFDILLQAVKILKQRLDKFQVKIVGDGDDIERLKNITVKLGIKKFVEFTGYVSEQEKARILSMSWINVNTSPKEGWGLTSLEAQASGTLSIVPISPGLLETVIDKKTGFLYPFGDLNSLSNIIEMVIKKRNLVKIMGRNATKWAENFSWETSALETEELIESILY